MAYINRAGAYRDRGDFDKAIVDYTEGIRLDPEDARAYNNRGLLHDRRGDFNKAIADCTPKPSGSIRFWLKPYNNRGHTYADNGEFDKAIADYNEAIRLNPDFAVAYNNRGVLHGEKGRFFKAIADCSKAVRLDPDCAEAYYNRGAIYSANGAQAKAEADWAKAKELGYERNDRGEWPGIEGGRISDALVSELDLLPTLLDFLGIEPPKVQHGVSLRGLLEGKPGGEGPRLDLCRDRPSGAADR